MSLPSPATTSEKNVSGKLCVGLTGGIGCGKSTVADIFKKLGAGIIDTDEIAHHLTQTQGAAIPAIRLTFGSEYINNDGKLNRDKMRELIFSDTTAKQKLETILHPLILEQTKAQLQQLHTMPYIIIVVPLLLESAAFQQLIQRILVVDCDKDTQIARVIARNDMDKFEIENIIVQQTTPAVRLKLADDVIHNDGDTDMDSLTSQVTALHEYYLKRN